MEHNGLCPEIFRFHCFNAEPLYIEAEYTDDQKNHYTNIYDAEWHLQPVRLNGRSNTPSEIPRPKKLDQAMMVATSLSKGIDYCRVDLYITRKKIYFSEFTFTPSNGREKFFPAEWDARFGVHWNFTSDQSHS